MRDEEYLDAARRLESLCRDIERMHSKMEKRRKEFYDSPAGGAASYAGFLEAMLDCAFISSEVYRHRYTAKKPELQAGEERI